MIRSTVLTKTTAAQNEVALSYKVRGLYFLAVVFEATIVTADADNAVRISVLSQNSEGTI